MIQEYSGRSEITKLERDDRLHELQAKVASLNGWWVGPLGASSTFCVIAGLFADGHPAPFVVSIGIYPMDATFTVIPGLTRDPEAAANWIPAFAGMTKPSICSCMTDY